MCFNKMNYKMCFKKANKQKVALGVLKARAFVLAWDGKSEQIQ